MELEDNIFQTIQLVEEESSKAHEVAKAEEQLSIRDWGPSRWECDVRSELSAEKEEPMRQRANVLLEANLTSTPEGVFVFEDRVASNEVRNGGGLAPGEVDAVLQEIKSIKSELKEIREQLYEVIYEIKEAKRRPPAEASD